jgi:hypothetical protein
MLSPPPVAESRIPSTDLQKLAAIQVNAKAVPLQLPGSRNCETVEPARVVTAAAITSPQKILNCTNFYLAILIPAKKEKKSDERTGAAATQKTVYA